jgi:hypothetical protein
MTRELHYITIDDIKIALLTDSNLPEDEIHLLELNLDDLLDPDSVAIMNKWVFKNIKLPKRGRP